MKSWLPLIALTLTPTSAIAGILPTTMINGKPLPGSVQDLTNQVVLFDQETTNGKRVIAIRGTRLQGTRTPIHIHEHGGITCIISGEITDFVENHPVKTYGPGDCYYMPANTPMAAYNSGNSPTILIDIFTLPDNADLMTIIEPKDVP